MALAEIVNQQLGTNKRRSSYHTAKLLRYCGSLLRKPDHRNIVELAHYSVKEYLLKLEERSEFHFFRVDIASDRELLGTYCLEYLLLRNYEIGPRTSREEHQSLQEYYPFREAAIRTWRQHAVGEDGTFLSKRLLKLAQSLFSVKRPMWFESFILESYLWDESLSYTSTKSTLSQAAEKVRTSLPIHWAAFGRLPELIDGIIKKDPQSVHVSSNFGTPLHCALRESFARVQWGSNGPCNAQYNSAHALIGAHIDVNRSFKFENRELCSLVLTKLKRPLGLLLLESGLKCDRECLNALYQANTNFNEQTLNPPNITFDDVQEKNIFVCDQPSWLSMIQNREKTTIETEFGNNNLPNLEQFTGSKDEILVFCAKYRKTPEAQEFIQKNAVDINGTDCDGCTALHYACANDDIELVMTLLEFGADINIRDERGWTATHHIAQSGRREILDLLLKNRNQSLTVDNIGRTPVINCSI